MDKQLSRIIWLTVLGTAFMAPRMTMADVTHEYVGVKKCALCHKKEETGDQYGKWAASLHSHAFETLGTPAAKEVGAKFGIADPQQSGKCLKCHSTAYEFGEVKVSETIPVEEGVSCESCHGPGKDYMKKSVMENQEEAIANGLIIPNEAVCKKCHNEESPQYKEFKFAEFWEKIKHPNPAK